MHTLMGVPRRELSAVFLGCNHSQENVKTKTWRSCWYHKQKKPMKNLLLTSSNMAAVTAQAPEECVFEKMYQLCLCYFKKQGIC
jgi:hypothetical protein